MMKQFLLIFLSMQGLILEAITTNALIILLVMVYTNMFFSVRIVNIWNSVPNSILEASTINAFKARLDKFRSHQADKYDSTADLTDTENR